MDRVLKALDIVEEKTQEEYTIAIFSNGSGVIGSKLKDLFIFDNLNELRDWAEGVILQNNNYLKLPKKNKKVIDKDAD